MPFQNYAWAANWNVALAALANVENDLTPYSKLRRFVVRSQPVDPLPQRTTLASGRVRGDGRVDHAWEMVMNVAALHYTITKFGLTSAASAKATIYTRRHDLEDFARYNCYIVRPQPGNTLEYLRQNVVRVTWQFTGLVVL